MRACASETMLRCSQEGGDHGFFHEDDSYRNLRSRQRLLSDNRFTECCDAHAVRNRCIADAGLLVLVTDGVARLLKDAPVLGQWRASRRKSGWRLSYF